MRDHYRNGMDIASQGDMKTICREMRWKTSLRYFNLCMFSQCIVLLPSLSHNEVWAGNDLRNLVIQKTRRRFASDPLPDNAYLPRFGTSPAAPYPPGTEVVMLSGSMPVGESRGDLMRQIFHVPVSLKNTLGKIHKEFGPDGAISWLYEKGLRPVYTAREPMSVRVDLGSNAVAGQQIEKDNWDVEIESPLKLVFDRDSDLFKLARAAEWRSKVVMLADGLNRYQDPLTEKEADLLVEWAESAEHVTDMDDSQKSAELAMEAFSKLLWYGLRRDNTNDRYISAAASIATHHPTLRNKTQLISEYISSCFDQDISHINAKIDAYNKEPGIAEKHELAKSVRLLGQLARRFQRLSAILDPVKSQDSPFVAITGLPVIIGSTVAPRQKMSGAKTPGKELMKTLTAIVKKTDVLASALSSPEENPVELPDFVMLAADGSDTGKRVRETEDRLGDIIKLNARSAIVASFLSLQMDLKNLNQYSNAFFTPTYGQPIIAK